eukprot:6207700-Pleurochrysis_carterae.AAC.2
MDLQTQRPAKTLLDIEPRGSIRLKTQADSTCGLSGQSDRSCCATCSPEHCRQGSGSFSPPAPSRKPICFGCGRQSPLRRVMTGEPRTIRDCPATSSRGVKGLRAAEVWREKICEQ